MWMVRDSWVALSPLPTLPNSPRAVFSLQKMYRTGESLQGILFAPGLESPNQPVKSL